MNDCARLISKECLRNVDIILPFDFINYLSLLAFFGKKIAIKKSRNVFLLVVGILNTLS